MVLGSEQRNIGVKSKKARCQDNELFLIQVQLSQTVKGLTIHYLFEMSLVFTEDDRQRSSISLERR